MTTNKKPKKKLPKGFKWWLCPGGLWIVTTDMRTKKGKELLKLAINLTKDL